MPLLNILATTTTTPVTPADWQSVFDALTAQISVANVVAVIAGVISIGIGLVFMWFGVRKGAKVLMSAMHGKLRV